VDELSFACDAMLGRLARWLRLAGYDASFDPDVPGLALVGQARADGRWLLTCDRELAGMAGPRALLLRERTAVKQVSELRGRLPLAAHPSRFLTRCSRCNGLLEEVGREAVINLIPPYVATHAGRFVACRECGRVYWPGTHVERIVRTLETWFLA
jgi:hypothetical protein